MRKKLFYLLGLILILSACSIEKPAGPRSREGEEEESKSPSFSEKLDSLGSKAGLKGDKKNTDEKKSDEKKPFLNPKPKPKPELSKEDKPYVPKRVIVRVKMEEVDIEADTFKKPRYKVEDKELLDKNLVRVTASEEIPYEKMADLKKITDFVVDMDGTYLLIVPEEADGTFQLDRLTFDVKEKTYKLGEELFSKDLEEGEAVLIKLDLKAQNGEILIRYESKDRYFIETIPSYEEDGKTVKLDKGFILEN